MKNIVKTTEIIKTVQDDIATHMADGWMINPGLMRGNQGEIFKLALVNDCKTRMFSITEPRGQFSGDLVYRVEDFDFEFDFLNSFQVAWLGKGEEVKKVTFYLISDNYKSGKKVYTTNELFVKEAKDKRKTRLSNSNCNYDRYLNVRKSEIKKFLKKVPGYKRVKEENIKSLAVYFDWAGGKHYQISFYNKKALVYNL